MNELAPLPNVFIVIIFPLVIYSFRQVRGQKMKEKKNKAYTILIHRDAIAN